MQQKDWHPFALIDIMQPCTSDLKIVSIPVAIGMSEVSVGSPRFVIFHMIVFPIKYIIYLFNLKI
jgi:hypothetical protein